MLGDGLTGPPNCRTENSALTRRANNPYLFIGTRNGGGLSNMAMLELLRGMRSGLSVHGFRSTFKDWCSEATHTPNMVSEAALAHVVADKVEAAYRRGDLFQKRRKLMTGWARHIWFKISQCRLSSVLAPRC